MLWDQYFEILLRVQSLVWKRNGKRKSRGTTPGSDHQGNARGNWKRKQKDFQVQYILKSMLSSNICCRATTQVLMSLIYKYLYVCSIITPGMESQSQSESQSSPSAPSDNRKEYKEVPLGSLNLAAQEALLTSPSTGEIKSFGILVILEIYFKYYYYFMRIFSYLTWESIKWLGNGLLFDGIRKCKGKSVSC